MTHFSPQAYKAMLDAVREERNQLLTRISELEVVERYLADHVGQTAKAPANGKPAPQLPKQSRIPADLTKHDAAAKALQEFGGPAKIREIANYLLEHGYGTKLPRKILVNGLFTALKRKTDMFEQDSDARWKLKSQSQETTEEKA